MDLATVIGLVAAVGLFLWSMVSSSGGDLMAFYDTPSAILVIGGSSFVTLLACRLDRFLALAKICKNAFFARGQKTHELIGQFIKLADTARREGVLALQNVIQQLPNPILANGLQMVVDGTDADTIKQVMEMEADAIDQRHAEGKAILDQMAKYAPAMGMIGTLVGLVVMLKNMEDVSKIGPGMAVALLTTMYGAIIANVLCLPLADKLSVRHDEEMLHLDIIRAGILGLQAGDNPRLLEMKLSVFLSPKMRAKIQGLNRGGESA